MEKHAYLIMAHHRADLLQYLINAIDDFRNDIFIHLDIKSSLFPKQFYSRYSKLIFIDRINVNWGGYSQIECELKLLKTALDYGHHTYYHLLTGANFPLWNQDYIHNFFFKNNGLEFVGFDSTSDFSKRTKWYVIFSEAGKLTGFRGKIILLIRFIFNLLQIIAKIDRNKKHNYIIKKGCVYFSITENFVNYVLSKEKDIKKICRHTILCDEVFIQTILFNSNFINNVFSISNEYDGCQRDVAWPSVISGLHQGCNFSLKDIDFLLNSKRLFAMKFESADGIDVINTVKRIKQIP